MSARFPMSTSGTTKLSSLSFSRNPRAYNGYVENPSPPPTLVSAYFTAGCDPNLEG